MKTSAELYYAELRRQHDDPSRQVGWRHRIEQAYRFEAARECLSVSNGGVLDIGCGRGAFAQYLDDLGQQRQWTGIEPDPTFAAQAARYGEVLNAGFESVDTSRLESDVGVAIGTLTHAENPAADLRALLAMLEDTVSVFCVTVLDRRALDARPALALEHSASALTEETVELVASHCRHHTFVAHLFPTDLVLFGWRDSRPALRTVSERFEATVAGPWGVLERVERHAWLAVELGLFDEAAKLLEEAPPTALTSLLRERIQLAVGARRGR